MARIAIESTGCDKRFEEIYRGASKALKKYNDLEIILVAGRDKIGDYPNPEKLEVLLTDYTFDGGQKINKRKTSIFRAVELHKNKTVDAVIAPGDTVGSVFASLLLKRIPGVIKPAIPAHLPYKNVLIDVGASSESECEPEDLLQFAIIGKVYSEVYLGVENPLIGILNIGEEGYKGPEVIRNSRELIEDRLKSYNLSDKYFEGNTVAQIDNLDRGIVVVCGGFVGNNMLKLAEKILKLPYKVLKREVGNLGFFSRKLANAGEAIAYLSMRKPIENIKKNFDYKKYATCPLLGVKGNIMICHGKSDAETIANAINITKNYLDFGVNCRLEEEISKYGKL